MAGNEDVVTLPVSPSKQITRLAGRQESHDTRPNSLASTSRTRTVQVRPPTLPHSDPGALAGIEVLDLVSRTPLTEVWNARAADGSHRFVKVLFACSGHLTDRVSRLSQLRHPALTPVDVLDQAPGRLVLSMPAGDRPLRDALAECHSDGLAGIPRRRLLRWLRAVAEALDLLARQQELFHLALNPRSLVLDADRVLMADFGLAQLIWQPAGQSIAQLNSRYAAPELHHNQIGPGCDQYSLALIYHEMLTGCFPSPGKPARKGEPPLPNVDRLPETDRMLIARALNPDPNRRWQNAVELMNALEAVSDEADPPAVAPRPSQLTRVVPTVPTRRLAVVPPDEVMQTRLGSGLPEDTIRQRLEGFRQQWNARLVSADPRHLIMQMQTPRSFWQRWTGRQPGLEIHLQITPPDITAPAGVQVRTELHMDLRPRECTREQGAELLKVVGPLLVESVRTHLRVNARGRTQERAVWHHPLSLRSLLPDGSFGSPIECQGKDISLNGIGFYLPGQLPSSQVLLELPPTDRTPRMNVPARIVRVQGCGDGWYEVGAVLLPPDELPPDEPLDVPPLAG